MIKRFPLFSLLSISLIIKGFISYLYYEPLRDTPWSAHLYVDIWSWIPFLENCSKGLIPYVDFSKEYPVAAGMLFWIFSLFITPKDPDLLLNFHNVFFSSLELVNVVIFYYLLKAYNSKSPVLYALCYALLPTNLILTPFRYESLVNIFFFTGILLYKGNNLKLAAATLSIGSAFKWYPTFFLGIAEWRRLIQERVITSIIKNVFLFLAVFLAINLPVILIGYFQNGDISNWLTTYIFHVKRALYWDTPLGVLTLWFGYLKFEHYASFFSLLLMFIFFFIKPSLNILAKTIIITAAALVFNRAYSTQFHLWFIPLCLVYLSYTHRKKYLIFLILGLELLNIFIYPFSFTYSILELDGFKNGIAPSLAGLWTWGFGTAIMLRAYLLVELIIYMFDFNKSLIRYFTTAIRIFLLLLILYFSLWTLFY